MRIMCCSHSLWVPLFTNVTRIRSVHSEAVAGSASAEGRVTKPQPAQGCSRKAAQATRNRDSRMPIEVSGLPPPR